MKGNKILSIVLALAMMLTVLCSCGASDDPSSNTENGTNVNVQISLDPGTLDPYAMGYQNLAANIYQALFLRVNRTKDGLIPIIAKSYERIAPATFHIYLNENVHDADGNEIKASDVVFSLDTCKKKCASPSMVAKYASSKVIDDHTVEVIMESDDYAVEIDLLCYCPIVSEKAYTERDFAVDPVSTAPYQVKEWVEGATITLVKNDNYWQDAADTHESQRQNVDQITYKILKESSQAAIALEAGEVDIATFLSETDRNRLAETEGFSVHQMAIKGGLNVFFNCSDDNVFSDVRLRQAVAYAIDESQVFEAGYGSDGNLCYGYAMNDMSDFNSKWLDEDYYSYNVEKAAALMAEAGYDTSSPLKVRLVINTQYPEYAKVAPVIQANLKQIGIEMEVLSYDAGVYNTYVKDAAQYDMFLMLKSAFDVPHLNMYAFDQRSFDGTTTNFLKDDHFQELIEVALNFETYSEDACDELFQYGKSIVPAYMMCQGNDYSVSVDTIEGLFFDAAYGIHPGACTYSANFAG